jgi:hypothetical protein
MVTRNSESKYFQIYFLVILTAIGSLAAWYAALAGCFSVKTAI